MTFRNEEKIVVTPGKIFDLKLWISKNNGTQLHSPRVINSIYFDNWDFSMYHDSIEGVLPRKKIRLRNYDKKFIFNKNVKKEIKISSVEGRHKTSEVEKNPMQVIKFGIFDENYGICSSVINIVYNRSYFLVKNIRITLDEKIIYRRMHNGKISDFSDFDSSNILELKSNSRSSIHSLINNFPFERSRFSKYCRGIELIYKN